MELSIVHAADVSNEAQKRVLLRKALKHFDGRLDGKTLAVWGPSFKPKTDEMREAPSIVLVEGLLGWARRSSPTTRCRTRRRGGCPGAGSPTPRRPYGALDGADALLVVTEGWTSGSRTSSRLTPR